MSKPLIEIKGISKKYRLGQVGMTSLREDVGRLGRWLTGQKDATASSVKENAREFWALRDVSFDVRAGEVVGIIGRNGAGKSTLLKILSRITEPTQGEIVVEGRVGSLLEVGTGFHPELSGRDNVFLNGAILGMHRREIAAKFDEIVEFAEVGKFIDTPVKRYSSGMYVRLAFAIAAHLEPEILIVDEVLAVGDADFQKKCMGKMEEVSRNDGRTILFVSHNIAAVRQLTSKCAFLQKGQLEFFGDTADAVDCYHQDPTDTFLKSYLITDAHRKWPASGQVRVVEASFDQTTPIFAHEADVQFSLKLTAPAYRGSIRVSATIFSDEGLPVGGSFGEEFNLDPAVDASAQISVRLTSPCLAPGRYWFDLAVGRGSHLTQREEFDVVSEILRFEVLPPVTRQGNLSKWEKGWGHVLFRPLVCRTR
jgi:lipopolysaccharide transport system ATP-binding protein